MLWRAAFEYRLSRIDGRDGRLVWDVPLADVSVKYSYEVQFSHEFGDLDGDGSPEIVVPVHAAFIPGSLVTLNSQGRFELVAVSLRDGKRLWSRPLRAIRGPASFRVGDLDGDGRAEVVVADRPEPGAKETVEIIALDGRAGTPRWSWRGGNESDTARDPSFPIRLAAFNKTGGRTVCVNIGMPRNERRLVLLDATGRERGTRALGARWWITLEALDLDGDGCDELLFHYDGKLRAARENLDEIWSRPYEGPVRDSYSRPDGGPATIVIDPNIGLDGATGRPRWSGSGGGSVVLERQTTDKPPRLLTTSPGAITSGLALADDPSGRPFLPGVVVAPARRAADDPRWRRPLPWALSGSYSVHPLQIGLAGGAALVVLVVPVAIVRLARRRRAWGLPLLMALPVALAIPLVTMVAIRSLIASESQPISAWLVLLAMIGVAIGGLPVLVYGWEFLVDLFRRKWKRLAVLVGLTLFVSVIAGAYMLRTDLRVMPSLEYFDWSEWYDVLPIGAYAVGVSLLAVKLFGRLWRSVRRVFDRSAAAV